MTANFVQPVVEPKKVQSPWDKLPTPISLTDVLQDKPERPEELICGLLFKGGKALLSAQSKGRKTFVLMHLGLAIASGQSWCGFRTSKSNVLYLDLELPPHEAPERTERISEAAGIENLDGFYLQQLRGHRFSISGIKKGLVQYCRIHNIGLVIIDPYYKLSGGADEIGTEAVAQFLFELEELAQETGAAVMVAHHFTKGDSSQKSTIDLASGSGVFGRDPDLIIGMRELKDSTAEHPLVRMDFVARSFKPVNPIGLRWHYPLWKIDYHLDLELKTPNNSRGRPSEYSVDQIVKVLGNDSLFVSEWSAKCEEQIGIKNRAFMNLKAKDEGRITENRVGTSTLCRAVGARTG
jgi:hypothetical protein